VPEKGSTELQAVLERLDVLEKKLAATEAELAAAKTELARKDQIIDALQQRLFGSKSERLDPAQLQLLLDGAALGKPEAPPEAGDEQSAPEEPEKRKSARTRRKKADLFPRNLKVVIEGEIVPEEVAADPEGFVEIGEEHHDELEVVRAQLYWRRTVLKKFKSKTDRSLPPLIAPAPKPTLPGTLCGASLAAQVVVDKFCDHLPYYRQSVRMLRRHEARIGRQTLGGWAHATAEHLLPIGEAIKAELFEASCLEVDETPIDYLSPGHGKTKQGYLWVYLDAQGKTVLYDWQLGRGHDCLLDIIGLDEESGMTRFRGTIQCDGYSAYRALVARYGGIELAGCLAHIRRKFFEARKQAPEVAMPILLAMQRLYRIEEELREIQAPPDSRKLIRWVRSRPIVEELHELILKERSLHLPKSRLGEALNYALGQWEEFCLYLHDGALEIDNNLVENAIRPTKLGAKNYLFFGSAEAGVHNALLYTLIENCKLNDIDPERYLEDVIRELPTDPTAEQAAALTPRRYAARTRESVDVVTASGAA
jgi:transposase